jgi:hypothetical protein
MSIDQENLKAIDIAVESLKTIVTISTIGFTGLLTYGAYFPSAIGVLFYSSLCSLFLASVLGLFSINAIINKVFRKDADAINKGDFRWLNIFSILSMIAGLVLGFFFFINIKSTPTLTSNTNSTIISDDKIILSDKLSTKIVIEKTPQGKISKIIIGH